MKGQGFLKMTIDKLISNTQKLDIASIVAKSAEATKKRIIAFQLDQWIHGQKSTGKKIGKYKSAKYRQKKFSMNPLAGYGNVDLKLTGALHKATFVAVLDRSLLIESGDEKFPDLSFKYGKDIAGLTEKNARLYASKYLQPEAIKQIKKQLLNV